MGGCNLNMYRMTDDGEEFIMNESQFMTPVNSGNNLLKAENDESVYSTPQNQFKRASVSRPLMNLVPSSPTHSAEVSKECQAITYL